MAEKVVIKRCWAINSDMNRCEDVAAHAGNHSIIIEWEDSECFDPDSPVILTQPVPLSVVPKEPEKEEPVAPKGCVACGHKHKDGPCKCGCHEFIG